MNGCSCFAGTSPMPMGCAVCGHAPYAHGCPGQPADHEYAQPSGELMEMRLEARRRTGPQMLPRVESPDRVTPTEVIPLVPAQRHPELFVAASAAPTSLPHRVPRSFAHPKPQLAATAPPRRDDGRRPAPSARRPAVCGPDKAGTAPPTQQSPELRDPMLSPPLPAVSYLVRPRRRARSASTPVTHGRGRSPALFPPRRLAPYRCEAAA